MPKSPARRLVLAALLLGSSVSARAAGPGTSAATFLSLGYGARPLALGEAFVAMADDVSALHYNPAGLAFGPGQAGLQDPRAYELLVSHSFHIEDIRLTQAGFMMRPFGLSLTHLGLDGIERRSSETANPEGHFGASDLMLGLSYGRRVAGVGVGATAKLIRQSIGQDSASAYALDIGALKRFESLPVSVGAGVSNLGTSVRFVDNAYPLPLTFRVGATAGMTSRLPHAFSLQLDLPRDSGPVVRLGLEYLGFGPFALRAGYRTFTGAQRDAVLGRALGTTASGVTEFYGMFMGAGFRSRFGALDYTILPYGELGSAHRLSFSLRLGAPRPAPAISTHGVRGN